MHKVTLLLLLCLSLCSCGRHDDSEILTTLEEIQSTKDPRQGLEELDSIEEIVSEQSRYVRMRYEMVKARLHDRADDKPESVKLAKKLIEYFEKNGTLRDQQMAYYMAGSIFRDFKDAPTAIGYFLKSESIAEKIEGETESLLYLYTISNLSYLYTNVLNYQSCLKYSLKEYQLSLKLNDLEPTTITHLGYAYLHCDSVDKAFEYYDMALDGQLRTDKRDLEIISKLLYNYVKYKQEAKADTCARMILNLYYNNVAPISTSINAMGCYYLMKGKVDSATMCFENVLAKKEDLNDMHDVSKSLFETYEQRGDLKKAVKYAQIFIAVNDSLDLGKQQEEASTINNWYQYARDMEEENRIYEENRTYNERIFEIVIFATILIIILLTVFYHIRRKQLLKIISLDEKIKSIDDEKQRVEQQFQESECELKQAQKDKEEMEKALANVNDELHQMETELQEKMKRNREIISLLHQNQMETNAEETFERIKLAAQNKTLLSAKDWNDLYSVVDGQWPAFKEEVCQHVSPLTDQRKRVCYLRKAGFSARQIEDVTDISHSTVWRIVAQCEGWIV